MELTPALYRYPIWKQRNNGNWCSGNRKGPPNNMLGAIDKFRELYYQLQLLPNGPFVTRDLEMSETYATKTEHVIFKVSRYW